MKKIDVNCALQGFIKTMLEKKKYLLNANCANLLFKTHAQFSVIFKAHIYTF